MQLYSEEGTSVLILIIGILIVAVSGFSFIPAAFVLPTSLFSFGYLIWYRKSHFDQPADSMIGFIPGHYLILFAFVLEGSSGLLVYALWSILILTTLGYDLTSNMKSNREAVKLTSMIQYCIIWGVIVFLFQSLLINSLDPGDMGAIGIRLGLVLGGIVWVGIGLFRINRSFIERRS